MNEIKAAALALVLLTLLAAGCSGDEETQTGATTPDGTTVMRDGGSVANRITLAPDLESVGNFRPGPPDDEGNHRTSVDFIFDQKTYLTGSNRTSFHLVPKDGGAVLDGSDAKPRENKKGDDVITAVFPGNLEPGDFARGYVDSKTVSSNKQGDEPFNIGQAARISESATPNPDLLSVTKDADQFLFEFDQPLTQDDVVQDNGGLRLYFPDTRDTGATAVDKTGDPKVLRATFKGLPGDLSLQDAVGGFVTQGTVQGQAGENKLGGPNAFDEVTPLKDTGAEVCPAPEGAGKNGDGKGPTAAPDLLSINNFRRGPVTAQGEPRTCVDFVFDQQAYLKGGNRTSFHLIPANGGDALDASDVTPSNDKEGDAVVTAVFPGKLDPKNFPRGYMDSNMLTSRKAGANKENPFNVNQIARVSNKGTTENPDLVSVKRDGDQVLYAFDEPLTDDDVVQNTGGLRLYFPETDTSSIREAGAQAVKRKDDKTLRAYFGKDLPEGKKLADAIGGYVAQGAVQSAKGSRGANDGKSAFDELSPIGDIGTVVCPAPDIAGKSGEGKGPTEAPDLVKVDNFRRGPFTSQFTPTTCVDFTFDQKAYLTGSNRTSFHLAPVNGSDALDAADIIPQSDKEGDVVVTAAFPGDLTPKDFARGYVDGEIAASGTGGNEPTNVAQAEDVESSDGKTVNPDLVSITGNCDRLLFEFDQPLTSEDVVQDSAGLQVYYGDAQKFASERVEATDDQNVLAAFYAKEVELEKAAGGLVSQGTTQGQPSDGNLGGPNAFDEVSLKGACNTNGN